MKKRQLIKLYKNGSVVHPLIFSTFDITNMRKNNLYYRDKRLLAFIANMKKLFMLHKLKKCKKKIKLPRLIDTHREIIKKIT